MKKSIKKCTLLLACACSLCALSGCDFVDLMEEGPEAWFDEGKQVTKVSIPDVSLPDFDATTTMETMVTEEESDVSEPSTDDASKNFPDETTKDEIEETTEDEPEETKVEETQENLPEKMYLLCFEDVTECAAGDTFDPSGLTAYFVFSDGHEEQTDYDVVLLDSKGEKTAFQNLAPGTYYALAEALYKDHLFEDSVEIHAYVPDIEIDYTGAATIKENETVKASKIQVYAYYNNKSFQREITDYTYTLTLNSTGMSYKFGESLPKGKYTLKISVYTEYCAVTREYYIEAM